MTSAPAHTKGPSAGTIHQEVFQDEPSLAPSKRPAALSAGQLQSGQYLVGFNAHQLVLRAAVRAIERRCFGTGMVLARADDDNLYTQRLWHFCD
jgi:hypothetical protein